MLKTMGEYEAAEKQGESTGILYERLVVLQEQ